METSTIQANDQIHILEELSGLFKVLWKVIYFMNESQVIIYISTTNLSIYAGLQLSKFQRSYKP